MLKNIATKATFLIILFILCFTLVKAQVSANFSASPQIGCSPSLVRFTDLSTNNPTSWKWDLGNGTISNLSNPSVTYFNPGKYTIKLVVKNQNSIDSVIKTEFIEVLSKPVVAFGSSDTTGCFPLPISFFDSSKSQNSIVNAWLWDFGDGITSTLKNPTHIYKASGNFNVTLQVKNTSGCIGNLSKTSYIKINTGVVAKFINSTSNNCAAPFSINFQNQSTGIGTLGYLWLFGDNSTSTAINPTHIYNTAGTFSVSLIVTNSNGCKDTIVKANSIVLRQVKADFNLPDSACQKNSIVFSNTSLPITNSVRWNFGDGTTSVLTNPSKSFANTGIYDVKLVANFGACVDSIVKQIRIMPKPIVRFNGGDTNNCKAPFKVNFVNQSSSGVKFFWDFGDGKTSDWQTPNHTYTKPGNYTVKLRVTNPNGCMDSLIKTNYIIIKEPLIILKNLPDSGCAPFSKIFTANISSLDSITSYLWNLGDNTSSTSAAPSHTYNAEGIYPISLIVNTIEGCSDTAIITRGIITSSKPIANFAANPTNTCANTVINFSDLTTPRVNRWLWDFGDGTTSTVQSPPHQYLDTGYFDINLVVWNKGCRDTIKFPKYIHINPPIAKFTMLFDCKKQYERVFKDQSIGADKWYWDFGDGNTSTQKDPTYIYANPGIYNISLRVVNTSSGCEFVTAKQIQIIDVVAQFNVADTVVCKGTNVNFITNLSVSNVSKFDWIFGDNNTTITTLTNSIKKTYALPGNYTVRLITTDLLGCIDTLVKPNYIRVNGPTAKFKTTIPSSCLNKMVTFIDSSISDGIHPIQTWIWNYGDGIKDTLINAPFEHNYQTPGAYTVNLKVIDSEGCADSIKLASSFIVSKPKAKFITVDTLTCPGKQIKLKDSSIGLSLTRYWDFGDGTPADTSLSPAHLYNSNGNYTITLLVTDQYGCKDTAIRAAYVNVVSPISVFAMSDSISNCPPLIIDFSDSSSNALNYVWDFGDSTSSFIKNPSHFYSYPGTYVAKQTITGPGGCVQTSEKTIVIKGPRGTFKYQPLKGCKPLEVKFEANVFDKASIIWDFNDGATQSSNDSTISYTYNFPGWYIPKLILVNDEGCQVPIRGKDTIFVNSVSGNFNILKNIACDSGLISFTNASISNDLITNYSWNFGDGANSTLANPSHYYTSTGIRYPSLIVTTLNGCKDTVVATIPVKIVASPKIGINATPNGCTPLNVTFTSQQLVADTSSLSWNWNFKNGNTATAANPAVQNYATSGVYNINLVAINSSGCSDSTTKQIEAYAIPNVNAGPPDTILCKGGTVNLNATGAINYTWSPAIGLNCTNCASPVTSSYNDITYTVMGTTIRGCSAKDSIGIIVKNRFTINYSAPDTLCKGQIKKLSATGAKVYSWSPTVGLDNPTISNPVAQPDTTTNYMVIGSDGVGCFQDTGFVHLRVFPYPTVEAGANAKINVGQVYDLTPIISPDVIEVDWQPTTGLFRNTYPGITVKPTQNTEYTVAVKNSGGCVTRDRVSIFVICDGTNIFIPNTFSPNGDGANDIFYPRGSGLLKVKNFRIFNRWGEAIFEKTSFDANNPTFGWDGMFKGAALNADVFVYTIDVICDNKSVLNYKGNVALIR